jgi:hypothetical protein
MFNWVLKEKGETDDKARDLKIDTMQQQDRRVPAPERLRAPGDAEGRNAVTAKASKPKMPVATRAILAIVPAPAGLMLFYSE